MALPKDYKGAEGLNTSSYMKFEEGNNKFRVLADIEVGYVWWDETPEGKRPRRVRTFEEVPQEVKSRSEDKVQHTWLLEVYNYNVKAIQVLEITQATVQDALRGLEENPDWGDLCTYDVTVKKEGKGLETKYTTSPSPHKDLAKDIMQLHEDTFCNLEAMFRGGNPFDELDDAVNMDLDA